ncbi:glycosyl transferase, group 1 [Staphylothermus marinus F1]|uniref:Glycosyl transferase, group 1 n=1 Tax=Staphylothermus marinus (strain ATCC 43588 / DSM 3639 / JCM 9404 / F1) TaxID=399550 RepID=A3DL49_STAMF|nr:glycogen/starch/alpha-glucan phosphorylase [Staphylothermus marinus]ABN69359.1 glycosyl transferase, group 1 [Staphylothermus marinus F1]
MVIVSITPEIGLDELKTYAGGLGVLEGDKLYGAGDMGLDFLVLTIFYRDGYVKYRFNGEEPIPEPEEQPEEAYKVLKPDKQFKVVLRGEEIIVQPWIYSYKTARAVLFEAICPMWARRLTDRVYIEDSLEHQFLRYALLAKASAYYLKNRVGLENISIIDLEEAHTALTLLSLNNYNKFRIIIHTPGPWGHPGFPGDFIAREFGTFMSDYVSLTELALERLKDAIVVSKKQEDVIGKVFPRHKDKIRSITNGICLKRWMNPKLYKAYVENKADPSLLKEARREAREKLVMLMHKYKGNILLDNRPIIAWVRRLARYKRPYFIARFIEENPDINAFFLLGGKPHPRDNDGLNYARWFRRLHLRLSNVVYIHEYDISTAKTILQGSDLLLFTPFSGWEACGTSYMKALANGIPILSSRDGGVIEIVEDNVNSWLFGEDIRDFINIYSDPRAANIDEKDYEEFKKKLLWIIDIYNNDPEKYWEIAFNAYKTVPEKVNIINVLKKYYIR